MSVESVNFRPVFGADPSKDMKKEAEVLKKAAQEFESLFIYQMLKTMRESVMKSDLFHGGNAEDMYTSLFDAEVSKSLSYAGGIGLEKILLEQLSREIGTLKQDITAPGEVLSIEKMRESAKEEPAPAPQEISFGMPVKGRVSSSFGLRNDPFTGEKKFHRGMDIAASEGTPVYPSAPGKVIFSGVKDGYGNIVEILHDNGIITKYGHNEKNIVKQGDTVKTSEPIAYVGSTGRSTGPHLHFEVVKDGVAIDPVKIARV